jgi:hypothetical protein
LKGEFVAKQKLILFYSTVVLWGIFILALTVYLFFPYHKALRITLQNIVGSSRAAISMEGVTTKPFGIKANKLLYQIDSTVTQRPIEMTNIDITWSPFSLLFGRFSILSEASLYGGSLQSSVEGIRLVGLSNPSIFLMLKEINMSIIPEGTIPWLHGTTGTLNCTIKKKSSPLSFNKQSGSFVFTLKDGEIKDFQVKNLPRLIIPYKEISADGKIEGSRINITKVLLTSELITFNGLGAIDSIDSEQNMDIHVSYQSFVKTLPLRGQGNLHITGNLSSPILDSINTGKDLTVSGNPK